MNDETPKHVIPDTSEPPKVRGKAKALAGSAMKTADTAGKIAEGAGTAFSAVKWIAIAATFGFILIIMLTIYKAISAPVKVVGEAAGAVGEAAGAVSESVKSGANSMKQSTGEMLNRLDVAITDQAEFNRLSEKAFAAVSQMEAREPNTLKQRVYWRASFSGHENKVCTLFKNFGADPIEVLLAADNKAYAAAKALGSKNDRHMRAILRAPGDDVPFNIEWDGALENWALKWKSTTVKKSLEDNISERRIIDVLESAVKDCR